MNGFDTLALVLAFIVAIAVLAIIASDLDG